MNFERPAVVALFVVALTQMAVCAPAADDQVVVTPPSVIANGTLVVCWKKPAADSAAPRSLLVHFHGAPETVQAALARSDVKSVLAVVNFPGLSSAYSQPFAADAELFPQILQRAAAAVAESDSGGDAAWGRISVSSFSAGYGAVREILKTPAHFDRIDSICAVDSIYAGLRQKEPTRLVNEEQMSGFLRFATLAVDNQKTFVISHSAQPTPYASTTETADYLLRSLNVARRPNTSLQIGKMRQVSQASRGRFLVLGFAGESGPDHLQHLRNIDRFWGRLMVVRQSATTDRRWKTDR